MMARILGLVGLATLITLVGFSMSAEQANAVVYCKTVGVPKGCVARPVVAAPAVRGNVVYCKTRGVPRGCVMR